MWFTHRIKEQNSKIAKNPNSKGSKHFITYERHDIHKKFQNLALKIFGKSGVFNGKKYSSNIREFPDVPLPRGRVAGKTLALKKAPQWVTQYNFKFVAGKYTKKS